MPAALQSLDRPRARPPKPLAPRARRSVAGVSSQAAALDARLRLPACGSPLATTPPLPRGTQARVLVRVACTSSAAWTLNVPVEIRRAIDGAGVAPRRGPRRNICWRTMCSCRNA